MACRKESKSGLNSALHHARQRFTTRLIKNASPVDYFDIRDDRVNYYLSVGGSETKTLYYMVRAVSRGRFIAGPASLPLVTYPSSNPISSFN
ncbi:hypothetical protein [uncultured Fibrella sp.]|uniref:alpha-2-macroglobulin family protein n=1 Tax=uncultured Fibrella sp. TaxID=1284596 RepID=UPI0035CB7B59